MILFVSVDHTAFAWWKEPYTVTIWCRLWILICKWSDWNVEEKCSRTMLYAAESYRDLYYLHSSTFNIPLLCRFKTPNITNSMCNNTATFFTLKEKTPSNTTRECTRHPNINILMPQMVYYCKLDSSNDKEGVTSPLELGIFHGKVGFFYYFLAF